ncbi:maleylacetate reductase [Nonomuraea basaltis]|uniref:maleylacetate reductase n=1 Tax=Nonomuraea basaltis TaxID=2495887 RepID=UPI00110C61C8|nr:maleylacetate reductase [Nonomuraea basaltis]TMR94796.1 maleylacetate reductase [Nonomuraea basaltis]
MRDFTYETPAVRIVFGTGCAERALAEEIGRLGARRLLIVTTPRTAPLAATLAKPLPIVATFDGVRPHVPVDTVDRAVALATRAGADALLSVGGGSTTGTAKAIALRMSLPIVAVPTTYAGSEVTPVWGTTEGARKTTGRSPAVVPKTVLYDPALTMTLPAAMTAASAMNAMAHCVEAFYAPGANPITDLVATEGVRVIAGALPAAVADPAGVAGRSGLLYGAYLAGSAFAGAGSGLHHKICHVLGGAFDLPHAETHTVLLPHVAAFNESAVPALRTRVAPALGADDVAGGLNRLAARIGAPMSLAQIGLAEDDLDVAVRLVLEKDLSDNPRHVGEPEIRGILRDALYGGFPAATRGGSG